MTMIAERTRAISSRISEFAFRPEHRGRIVACDGLLLVAEGLEAPVGALIEIQRDDTPVPAEVVGFRDGKLLLMALSRGAIAPGATAVLLGYESDVPVGPELLGRVVDAMGQPVDDGGPLRATQRWPLGGRPLPPLARAEVDEPLITHIRAIDLLFTLGRGQRVGLIAGSGVGKSMLLQQLVAGAEADAIVVGLIGERGREIAGFINGIEPSVRERTHVVAVPADYAAPLRIRGTMAAFSMAESLRAQGQHVLLLIDSLTRVAHAQREMGLAVGEPVGMRGYPPSALALIPRLVERVGNDAKSGGAITALMTVLADGDDVISDPVVDTARGVLDGHIILDRKIAASGRFPAIHLGLSISRTMSACVSREHLAAATALRRDATLVDDNRDLIQMGGWTPGQDPVLDRALERYGALEELVAQPHDERADFNESLQRLITGWGEKK